jgi:hypothetical protein
MPVKGGFYMSISIKGTKHSASDRKKIYILTVYYRVKLRTTLRHTLKPEEIK